MTLKDADKEEGIEIARRFEKIGYRIYATRGTAKVLQEAGVNAIRTNKIEQESPNLLDLILGHKIDLVIDTPSQGVEHSRDGFLIRRTAIETGVNVLTGYGYRQGTRDQPGEHRYQETDPDRYRNREKYLNKKMITGSILYSVQK